MQLLREVLSASEHPGFHCLYLSSPASVPGGVQEEGIA